MYICVIEDDEPSRKALVRWLTSEGHRACWAATGTSGLKVITFEQPDLVLLDIMLPDMTGIEVLLEKARKPDIAAIPVIIVTGLSLEELREEALPPVVNPLAAVKMVLSKPIEFDTLREAIRCVDAKD